MLRDIVAWGQEEEPRRVLLVPPSLLPPSLPPSLSLSGQLAALTALMALAGSLARLFTTLKELGPKDPQLLVYALSFSLNAVVMAQIVWYRQATAEAMESKERKGGREGGKEGGSPVRRSARLEKRKEA
jgi:hypothetical protein